MKLRDKNQERLEFKKRFLQALKLRNHSEKSLAELKEMFDVSRTLIHEWRTGSKIPSNYSAAIIAKKLDINFEWLLLGNGHIDGYLMETAAEVTLIDQFRNLTKVGKEKVMEFTFDECKAHEKTPKNKEDMQIAIRLVKEKT